VTLTLGCDPGVTGAFAVLAPDGALLALDDLPVIRDGRLAWIDADAFVSRLLELRAGNELHAYVERVHAMPRNGSLAAFSQGCTLGSILAALQVLRARIELVTPAVWKRSMGLSSDKAASLHKARLSFPNASLVRQKDHNRSEALLIASWALNRPRSMAA
jgi:crossover junction endodeoxyribonuclease RuvC